MSKEDNRSFMSLKYEKIHSGYKTALEIIISIKTLNMCLF